MENWNSKITNNTSVENYPQFPIPTPSNVPTLKPPNSRQEQREPPATLPISPVYDNDYLQAVKDLANDSYDSRLPGPIFNGQKLANCFGFAANAPLSTLEINMKNIHANGRFYIQEPQVIFWYYWQQ